jgi:predicted transcriptional regulator
MVDSRQLPTFVTYYALTLAVIARNPSIRIREIAQILGITGRAVQRILADLTTAGYIVHTTAHRRNLYEVRGERLLKDPIANGRNVGDLIQFLRPE